MGHKRAIKENEVHGNSYAANIKGVNCMIGKWWGGNE